MFGSRKLLRGQTEVQGSCKILGNVEDQAEAPLTPRAPLQNIGERNTTAGVADAAHHLF